MDGRNKKPLLRKAVALGLACFLSTTAFAVDDDLPAPTDGFEEDLPNGGNPPPQNDLPDYVDNDTMPDPAMNADQLPEPNVNRGRVGDVRNTPQEQDDIFLPTPAVQDNVNYAPLGTPVSSRTNYEDNDWRLSMNNRPAFSLGVGGGVRSYPDTNIPDRKMGYSVAGSWRVLNIAQTVFLHAYASATLFDVGDVGPYAQVKDITMHLGPMVEIGIGRRLSLYGSLLRRSNTIQAAEGPFKNPAFLSNVDEPTSWQLGFGGQWDFYVIPHGSLGVRAHFERDVAVFFLTMALEPAPRKKLSLNFDPVDR